VRLARRLQQLLEGLEALQLLGLSRGLRRRLGLLRRLELGQALDLQLP